MLKNILELTGAQKLDKNAQNRITGGVTGCPDQDLACESCKANGGLWISGLGDVCGYCYCDDSSNQR
jgi:hypothetical protein